MNKFAKVICMIAVVALAFTSCKKNENNDALSFEMNGSTQQFVEIYDEDGGEKAYLNSSNKIQFEDGDKMMLFNCGPTKKLHARFYYNQAGNNWKVDTGYPFSTDIATKESDGYWYAFYPGENVTASNDELPTAKFALNATQVYDTRSGQVTVPQGALYMAAKDFITTHTTLASMKLEFQNICGILAMKFYSPSGKKVTSIDVTDNRFNIVGTVQCNIDAIDMGELQSRFNNYEDTPSYNAELYAWLQDELNYSLENGNNTVTLDCGSGVQLGRSRANATRFLLVMRPLALLHGATITIHFDGAPDVIINSDRDNRISPNTIRNMSTYNVG